MKTELILSENEIKGKIYSFCGLQVMLDDDMAKLYNVSTKALNHAVKRNIERFPSDFMFQLTKEEKNELVINCDRLKTLKVSYVFTEHDVAMLSGVLKSETAVRSI